MQSLAVSGYLAADVLYALRGIRGRREWRFRYELLTSANVFVRELANVLGGSVDHDLDAEVKRTAKFTVEEDGLITYGSQRVKPYVGIKMPDGGYAEWPQGVFLLTTPTKGVDISGVVLRNIDAYDQTMVLQEDTVAARYYVSSGYNVVTAVNEVLAGTVGINSYSITANAATMPSAVEWDPGTSKYQIINDLLALINYKSLWFDGNGTARSSIYTKPSDGTSEFTYQTDVDSVILPDSEQTLDYYKVPNRWVLIVSNPDQTLLRSEIINTNPASPTSTVSRGRTITKVVNDTTATTQGVLDSKADLMREDDSNIFEEVVFKTGLMPFHESGDIYTFNHTDLGVNYKYAESKWSFELVQGAEMGHTARRTVAV